MDATSQKSKIYNYLKKKKKKKKGLSKQGQEWIDEESFLYSAILCLQALGPFYIDSLALN
jgi:hypothetical protein